MASGEDLYTGLKSGKGQTGAMERARSAVYFFCTKTASVSEQVISTES